MFWIAVQFKTIILLLELVELVQSLLWDRPSLIMAPLVGAVALLVLPYLVAVVEEPILVAWVVATPPMRLFLVGS